MSQIADRQLSLAATQVWERGSAHAAIDPRTGDTITSVIGGPHCVEELNDFMLTGRVRGYGLLSLSQTWLSIEQIAQLPSAGRRLGHQHIDHEVRLLPIRRLHQMNLAAGPRSVLLRAHAHTRLVLCGDPIIPRLIALQRPRIVILATPLILLKHPRHTVAAFHRACARMLHQLEETVAPVIRPDSLRSIRLVRAAQTELCVATGLAHRSLQVPMIANHSRLPYPHTANKPEKQGRRGARPTEGRLSRSHPLPGRTSHHASPTPRPPGA